MLNRWVGISSAALMLLANAAIFQRDVLPDWFATDPPRADAYTLQPGEERLAQVGIFDERGRLVGRSWTRSRRPVSADIVITSTTTQLRPVSLPGGVTSPPARIETEVTHKVGVRVVDELSFQVFGLGMPIELRGETMPTGEFPILWKVGPQSGSITLDTTAPAALGDVIRPFDRLPELYVGQSWRLELLNPLKHVLPQLEGRTLGLESVLVQVTGEARIEHGGRTVDVFVVEGGGATAYVGMDGTVLRQVVRVPLLGRLELLDEVYDEEARIRATSNIADDTRPHRRRGRHAEQR